MRALHSLAILLLAALVAGLLTLSAALAHAGLVAADPADGSVLPSAPAALTLTFTEPVSPLLFTLVTSDGERRDLTGAVPENLNIRLPLPPDLPRGTHLVSWRVTSADGHPIAGALAFSIGEAGTRPSLIAGTDPLLAGTIWLARATLYALLFLGVGTTLFGRLVAPLPSIVERLSRSFCVAGLLLAPLALGPQGLDALDAGFARLFSAAPWAAALSTSYAATVTAVFIACLAALLSRLSRQGRLGLTLALVAAIATALAPMLSGHAGTAPPTWLSKPAVFVHIAGLLFWIGALLPLGWLLRAGDAPALAALQRFSRLIPWAIAPVILSGLLLALLQLGPPGPAWQSPYVALLAAKLALLLPLFGLALWNRAALTQPTLAGVATARRRLRRSIGIELLLVLLVFGVVADWRFTPPPRVIAELAAQPARTHIHTNAAMADIAITPGRAGASTLSIWLSDAEFGPLTPQALRVALSNPALGVERLVRPATHDPDGFWRVPLTLPAGGAWTIELDLRIDDFTLLKLSDEIELAP
jgi:copper transport protein